MGLDAEHWNQEWDGQGTEPEGMGDRDPHFQALGAASRLGLAVARRGDTVQVTAPSANALCVLGCKTPVSIPSPQPVTHPWDISVFYSRSPRAGY